MNKDSREAPPPPPPPPVGATLRATQPQHNKRQRTHNSRRTSAPIVRPLVQPAGLEEAPAEEPLTLASIFEAPAPRRSSYSSSSSSSTRFVAPASSGSQRKRKHQSESSEDLERSSSSAASSPSRGGSSQRGAAEALRSYVRRSLYGQCRSVEQYEKLDRIGEGTYGVVFKGRDRRTGRIVALKKVRMERERDGIPITCLREISILKELNHPNVVQLLDVVVGNRLDSMFLVFEYVEHDLAGLIDNMKKPFSESEVKCLLRQLLRAIAYMHDNFFIHRDLKLSNLLFSNRGELKLCDYGLARIFGEPIQPMTPKVVTLWYRAPELLLGDTTYTVAVDMWAVGCIFGELLLNEPFLPGKTELEQIQCIFDLLGTANDKIWPGFSKLPHVKKISLPNQPYNNLERKFKFVSREGIDLLNKLLTYNPTKRLTAHEALNHPYFSSSPLPKAPDMMPSFPPKSSHDTGYRRTRQPQELQETRQRRHLAHNERFGEAFGDSIFNRERRPSIMGPSNSSRGGSSGSRHSASSSSLLGSVSNSSTLGDGRRRSGGDHI
ncbi:Cyclin-dependent kinase 10 [Balamuthia mandrillaris]